MKRSVKIIGAVVAVGAAVLVATRVYGQSQCGYYTPTIPGAWTGWVCDECYGQRTYTDGGCAGPALNTECDPATIPISKSGQCINGSCQFLGWGTTVGGHVTNPCPTE
jgi:hypothetical protein